MYRVLVRGDRKRAEMAQISTQVYKAILSTAQRTKVP
nr:MAG TPA: hypothetical protein [Bacteriophage sp.]